MQKNKTNIINLGCRLNIYEGEVIKSLIKQNQIIRLYNYQFMRGNAKSRKKSML